MSSRRSLAKYLLPISLFVALSFDFLFWDKQVGISFPIFVAISLGAGFWLARETSTAVPRQSIWLLPPIAFFALIGILRLEPFSLFLSRGLTLLLMALLAANFIGGRWPHYSLSDYLAKLSLLPFSGLSSYRSLIEEEKGANNRGSALKGLAPIGRGFLIALPFLCFSAYCSLLLIRSSPNGWKAY